VGDCSVYYYYYSVACVVCVCLCCHFVFRMLFMRVKRLYVALAGVLVLAKYSDGRWYRAAVMRVLGYQLEVELIDFGSIICVSATDG